MSDSDNSGKFSYFLVGVGIGALLGILFAPKAGEETREILSRRADEGKDYAQRKARELRARADELLEHSEELVKGSKDKLTAALDAGKEAYQREAKSKN
jgi:gas vesicle protein